MVKRYFFLLLLTLAACPLSAQLPDGIVAPDFTATDIQGNTWNLYELLDQGKSVVLHFGATWCDACWQYHQSGVMNEIVQQYGNEIVPFFIEADDGTTVEDLNGTGVNTLGDWVSGTLHPILDSAGWLGNLYALDDVSRIYLICPSRILTNAAGKNAAALYETHTGCQLPFGQFNAAMLGYDGFQGEFCGEKTFQPIVRFQNLGTENITDLALQLFLNGNLAETRHWQGNLPLYQVAGIAFDSVTTTENTEVKIAIQAVNNQPDEAPGNDSLLAQIVTGVEISTNFLVLELHTDDYPLETYWEILDADSNVFHRGGNLGIFTGEVSDDAYTDGNTSYEHEVALPANGCYELVIYDQYADGLCCGGGFGYYRLKDENNFIYLQGGVFGGRESRPFRLSGNMTLEDNAAIKEYLGARGDICGEFVFAPELTIQNLGANDINSLEIKALKGIQELQTFTWSGNLSPSQSTFITMDDLAIDTTAVLELLISKVNGQPDTFDFQNNAKVRFFRRLPKSVELTLEIGTDEWGYENYWQLTNSAGKLVATGGNQSIGADGGGLQVALPTDPGSYPQFSTITETITLIADANECYEFLFVDDWGDGIFEPGYLKLTDAEGNLIFDFRPLGTYDSRLIDGQFAPSETGETAAATAAVSIFPNPASGQFEVEVVLKNGKPVRLEIVNALGEVVFSEEAMGSQRWKMDATAWENGLYWLKITQDDGSLAAKRFVVAR